MSLGELVQRLANAHRECRKYPRVFALIEFSLDAVTIAGFHLIACIVSAMPQRATVAFYSWLSLPVPSEHPETYLNIDPVRALATVMTVATMTIISVDLVVSSFIEMKRRVKARIAAEKRGES